jgi:hypothetical protein
VDDADARRKVNREIEGVSPQAAERIKLLRAEQRVNKHIVLSPNDAAMALSLSLARIHELLTIGELSSILDGKLQRIFTASVFDYLVRRTIETYPVNLDKEQFK